VVLPTAVERTTFRAVGERHAPSRYELNLSAPGLIPVNNPLLGSIGALCPLRFPLPYPSPLNRAASRRELGHPLCPLRFPLPYPSPLNRAASRRELGHPLTGPNLNLSLIMGSYHPTLFQD